MRAMASVPRQFVGVNHYQMPLRPESRHAQPYDPFDRRLGHARDFLVRTRPLHGDQSSPRRAQVSCGGNESGEIGERARNYDAEQQLRPIGFDARVHDHHVSQPEFHHCLLHEGRFLMAAVNQNNLPLWTGQCERYSRKSGAGADIGQAALRQEVGNAKGVQNVMAHRFARISDRGQVIDLIPLIEQSQEPLELFQRDRREPQSEGVGAYLQCLGQRLLLADMRIAPASSAYRLRWTSSSETAAGVIPEILAACPRVSGRCSLSFCWASIERPWTVK